MHCDQSLNYDQSDRHRKVAAGSGSNNRHEESLQHFEVTSGSKQHEKAVSNTLQENERKDGCNEIDKFLVTLQSGAMKYQE